MRATGDWINIKENPVFEEADGLLLMCPETYGCVGYSTKIEGKIVIFPCAGCKCEPTHWTYIFKV